MILGEHFVRFADLRLLLREYGISDHDVCDPPTIHVPMGCNDDDQVFLVVRTYVTSNGQRFVAFRGTEAATETRWLPLRTLEE